MNRAAASTLVLAIFALVGCSRQTPVAPTATGTAPSLAPELRVDTAPLDRLERIVQAPDGGVAAISSGRRTVVVPEGSHDALAGALASVGAGGVVVLATGAHFESATVTIGMAATIIGMPGAVLSSSAGAPDPRLIFPALLVRADHVTLQGLAIQPVSGDGNCAVVIEGASDALLFRNRISGFQTSVLVASGDRTRIWNNFIRGTAVGDGIDLANGTGPSVLRNEISNASFGVFPSGIAGVLAFNRIHDCGWGVVLCTVPQGSAVLPDGTLVGAEFSATRWLTTQNTTVNNLFNGILVIDNANNNLIADNASSGNGSWDIELAGNSNRFGFFTPASHDNTFFAGRYATVIVKNCGTNNRIIGGALVDNTVHPCD